MMWWLLLATPALAGPPEPETVIEVVHDEPQQGKFRIVFAGREGDELKVDGWPFGTLPVETDLAEGIHVFQLDGKAGRLKRSATLVVEADKVVEVDLAVIEDAPVEQEAAVQGGNPGLRSPSEARSPEE